MKRIAMAVVMVGLLAHTPPSRADSTTMTGDYVVGPGWMAMLPVCQGSGPGVGVVCFDPVDAGHVSVTVADASGLPVVALAMFLFGNDWSARKVVSFCGSTGEIAAPRGWTSLMVHVGLTSSGFTDTFGFREGVCGRAIKGTVTAMFSP